MGEMRSGLDRGEFKIFLQPKVDLVSRRVTHAECLIRWFHPRHGFMSPDDFIPLAEKTGTILKLTEWVLHTAFALKVRWQEQGLAIHVAVNLSARDLLNPRLPVVLRELLRTHPVAAEEIVLELTESAIMVDPAEALRVIRDLHGLGFILSVDDFGTGYSSMAYLKRLPLHELKIDKAFVLDLATSEEDQKIVRSVVDLGHMLGLKVIAEGVEDEASLALLGLYGCDMAQGYFFSKPLSEENFEAWYNASPWGLGAADEGPA
jgi:EAL domain-containing protein (putative c-di-GMP-specific phosphodiesterase class I)